MTGDTMQGFLGETPVDPATLAGYADFSRAEWAMLFIRKYGQIDGAHHKSWVLDQVARILRGTPVLMTVARWDNGQAEYRFETGEPSAEYLAWRDAMLGAHLEDGRREYGYEEGCAPGGTGRV
jgi:hypothetical protein